MTSPKELGKPEGLRSPLLDTGAQPTAGLMEAEHAGLVIQSIILSYLYSACSRRLLIPYSLHKVLDSTKDSSTCLDLLWSLCTMLMSAPSHVIVHVAMVCYTAHSAMHVVSMTSSGLLCRPRVQLHMKHKLMLTQVTRITCGTS